MAPAVPTYAPRDPSQTVLYHVIAEHLETFLASRADDPEATGFPAYVQREFYAYLRCGILAHGFLRLGCDTCHHELLVPCGLVVRPTKGFGSRLGLRRGGGGSSVVKHAATESLGHTQWSMIHSHTKATSINW